MARMNWDRIRDWDRVRGDMSNTEWEDHVAEQWVLRDMGRDRTDEPSRKRRQQSRQDSKAARQRAQTLAMLEEVGITERLFDLAGRAMRSAGVRPKQSYDRVEASRKLGITPEEVSRIQRVLEYRSTSCDEPTIAALNKIALAYVRPGTGRTYSTRSTAHRRVRKHR